MKKKGQIKLSFGMIFSIIMIIIFLAFGVYVILKFLDMKNIIGAGIFLEDLQNDVDKMWKSSQGSQEKEYFLPLKIEAVCLVDFSLPNKNTNEEIYKKLNQAYNGNENLFFYPVGSGEGIDATKIEHLNLEEITKDKNPHCIEAEEGKITITIKKNFDDALVIITQ